MDVWAVSYTHLFHFAPSTSSYKMFVDQSKLDKIVYNLLSNALKYTPKGGKVVFAIIEMCIRDR